MTWYPIAFLPPQYVNSSGVPYSGAVLKAYAAGTSTVIAMATDYTGVTTANSIALNASGFPVYGGNVVIPHLEENYKLALYPTQAAADANSGAIWPTVDNIQIAGTASSATQGLNNRFINGAFDVWQRGSSFTITAGAAAVVTADCWKVDCTGANMTVGRVAPSFGARYMLSLSAASGITGATVRQRLESNIATLLKGQYVTVQFQIYNNGLSTFTPTITINRANAVDDFSAVTAVVASASLQACAAGYTKVSYSFVNSTNGDGLEVILNFGTALNAASGAIYVGDADIRLGTEVQAVEYKQTALTLVECQRYYEISEGNSAMFHGDVTNSGSYYAQVPFKVTKLIAPTVTPSNVTIEGAASFDTASPTIVATKYGFKGTKSCLATSGDRGFNFAWTASAEL